MITPTRIDEDGMVYVKCPRCSRGEHYYPSEIRQDGTLECIWCEHSIPVEVELELSLEDA